MAKDNLIDYTLEEIQDRDADIHSLMKKIEKNKNYARVVLYLGIIFLNEHGRGGITSKEVNNNCLHLSNAYATQILDYLSSRGVLKLETQIGSIAREGQFRANLYCLNDENLLKDLIRLAKIEIIQGKKR